MKRQSQRWDLLEKLFANVVAVLLRTGTRPRTANAPRGTTTGNAECLLTLNLRTPR